MMHTTTIPDLRGYISKVWHLKSHDFVALNIVDIHIDIDIKGTVFKKLPIAYPKSSISKRTYAIVADAGFFSSGGIFLKQK